MTDMNYCLKNLLDFSRDWNLNDVNYLDSIVKGLHSDDPEEKKKQHVYILTKFVESEDAWIRVDAMLRLSNYPKTKYFALEIFGNLIKTKWKNLSDSQQQGFRNYVLTQISIVSSADELSEDDEKFLGMLNAILMQILEYEYPEKWPTFIVDLTANKTGTNQCLNILVIIKLMREKIFGIPANQVSRIKVKEIRESKADTFSEIFRFCELVIKRSSDTKLLHATIETVLQFIIWIPPALIFESNFTKMLIHRIDSSNRCITLQLLIAIVHVCHKNYAEVLASLFSQFVQYQQKMLYYKEANDKSLVSSHYYSVLFLSTILKKHAILFHRPSSYSFDVVVNNLLSVLEDVEAVGTVEAAKTLNLCMECLGILLSHLCCEKKQTGSYSHQPLMSKLRNVIISRISKPQKIIVKDDKGKVISETSPDANTLQIYSYMQKILVFLTYLDHAETVQIIIQKLHDEINNPEFSEKNLKSLCCAAIAIRNKSVQVMGFVERSFPKEAEQKLFWNIFQGILALSRVKKEKDNQKIVALNLMYIICEYAHYLNSRWDVLKLVVMKLFEFMHEKVGRTQNLACKAFIHVAQRCKEKLIEIQPGETKPYIDDILEHMEEISSDLKPEHVSYFYEAVGYIMVAGSPQADQKIIKERIQKCMALQNEKLFTILKYAEKSRGNLKNPKLLNDVVYNLKMNVGLCKSMGYEYVHQLFIIYEDILLLYKDINKTIYDEVQKKGIDVLKQPSINAMIFVRKEILKLISSWVGFIKQKEQCDKFLKDFLDRLYVHVLDDYHSCPEPTIREPDVLTLFTTMINSLQSSINSKIEIIFSFTLESTVSMIRKDQESFPEMRFAFAKFLQAIVTHCFDALSEIFIADSDQVTNFEIVVHSIIWAAKHNDNKDITITGLQTLLLLLKNVYKSSILEKFYETYYILILENMLFLVTEPQYTSGVSYKARIVSHMLKLIARKKIKPLNEKTEEDMPNDIFIQFYVSHVLRDEFQGLTENQCDSLAHVFFKHYQNIPSLTEYLKDLPMLIQEQEKRSKNSSEGKKNE